MPKTIRQLTRGEEALLDRLRDEAAEIARLRAHLAAAKRRRDALIAKARYAGFTVREIEKVAGISNARVAQLGLPWRNPGAKG